MRIVRDELKRSSNLRRHRIDFASVREHFDFARADTVETYGGRLVATGLIGHRMITVVFSLLGTQGLSVISARPASR